MLAKLRNKRKEKKGFTLLELIIVIAIIAILLALLVPNLTQFLGSAKKTSVNANAKTVYTGAASWASDLAADNVKITAGTITITNGTADVSKVVTEGTGTNYKGDLQDYINGTSIKNATIYIDVTGDYAIKGVYFDSESGDDGAYPNGYKNTPPTE